MTNSVHNSVALPRYPLKYPRMALVVIGLVLALLVFAMVFALWIAFCSEMPVALRVLSSLLAAGIVFLFARSAWIAIRRRWKTGQWAITEEERCEMAKRVRNPVWMRFMPQGLRNNPKDPCGLKFLFFCLYTPLFSAIAVLALLRQAHGYGLVFAIVAAYSAWDFLRSLPGSVRG